MIHLESSSPRNPDIPDNLSQQIDSQQWESFCAQFGSGLRYLIERSCSNHADACFHAVATASIKTMASHSAKPHEMAAVVRAHYRRILPEYSSTSFGTQKTAHVTDEQISGVAASLQIFRNEQQEALKRFYVDSEPAESICGDLGLSIEQFAFLRKVVRQSVDMRLNACPALSRKGPNAVSKTVWTTVRAGSGCA